MILLGSTGSIGTSTLEIAKKFRIKIEAISAKNNIELLQKQIDEFLPEIVVVGDKESAKRIRAKKVLIGEEGILELIEIAKSNLVVNAISGFAGLPPTIKALEKKKKVALANKESLVIAGAFLDTSLISPIDSEHFGIWYISKNRPIKRLILTASGGAFRDTPLKKLKNATIQEALKHPNWSMGKKITIDSATMTNKLYELLEARWLFGECKIDAIIETKSVVHALIEFKDGSTIAHLSATDMKLPISFALFGYCEEQIVPHIDLLQIKELKFKEIDKKRYPIWDLKDAILNEPRLGAILNSANESAVELFLNEKIGFLDISKLVKKAFKKFSSNVPKNLDEVLLIHKEVRRFVSKYGS